MIHLFIIKNNKSNILDISRKKIYTCNNSERFFVFSSLLIFFWIKNKNKRNSLYFFFNHL